MKVNTGEQCWFDLPTANEAKCMAFYKTVLGWNFIPMSSTYWMIQADQTMIGGLSKEDTMSPPSGQGFMPYFTVPSANEGGALVKKSGGTLEGEVTCIGEDMGYFQTFRDLDGNRLSLWSEKP